MSLNIVNSDGSLEQVAGLANSEKINEMYEAFPSDASSTNKLVTKIETTTIPLSKFQVSSGGAVGYADLGVTTSSISQAFSLLEVEYGRVDGFMDKYLISVAGTSSNLNLIRVVRLTSYGQTPTITLDADKHIWMSMDTYVYIRVKAYGNFSLSGTLSRTAPTGTVVSIATFVKSTDLTSTVTSGSTEPVTSGGVYTALYKRRSVSWNGAGNRYVKLSNLYSSDGLVTNTYVINCRNGETWLMYCGKSDGSSITAPIFHRLVQGTSKLYYFSWDSSTGEVALGTQGYNNISVTQISGSVQNFTMSALSSSDPLDSSTQLSYSEILANTVHGSVSPIGDTTVTVDVSSFCTDALSRYWEAQNKNSSAFSGACLYAYPASDTTVTMVMSRAASAAAFELYGIKRT